MQEGNFWFLNVLQENCTFDELVHPEEHLIPIFPCLSHGWVFRKHGMGLHFTHPYFACMQNIRAWYGGRYFLPFLDGSRSHRRSTRCTSIYNSSLILVSRIEKHSCADRSCQSEQRFAVPEGMTSHGAALTREISASSLKEYGVWSQRGGGGSRLLICR